MTQNGDDMTKPIEKRIPSGVQLRVKWDYDQNPDFSHLEHTPESYKKDPFYVDGAPLSFEEYMQFHGNPKRHIVLNAIVQHKCCEHCGRWLMIVWLANIHFMDTDTFFIGTVNAESIAEEMEGYQLNVSRRMIEKALSDL